MSTESLNEPQIPVVVGDTTPLSPTPHQFILRELRYSDVSTLAKHTAEAFDTKEGISIFLAPRAHQYPEDNIRNFRHNIWGRVFNPRQLSLVACEASDVDTPVGYGQFIRLGDDVGARRYINRIGIMKKAIFFVLSWILWVWFTVEKKLWPDRSSDKEAWKLFMESVRVDSKCYWDSHPERSNRWQAQMIIVKPEWQGKGIGRLILTEALAQAQKEGVIMGLAASPQGERLYRKMGFETLGDFHFRIGTATGGGHMIWYPDNTKEARG